jgi:hypothetical protein
VRPRAVLNPCSVVHVPSPNRSCDTRYSVLHSVWSKIYLPPESHGARFTIPTAGQVGSKTRPEERLQNVIMMTVRVLGICEHEVVIEHAPAVTATPVIT